MLKWFITLLLILPSSAEKPILESFEEKPFPTDDKKLESYRFTYLPTFDKPYLFRIDVASEEAGTLTIKRLSGKGGYELGEIELNKTVPLTGESFKRLLTNFRNPKVWKPFGEHPENADMLRGTDGEVWTLEGVSSGRTTSSKIPNPDMVPYFYEAANLQDDPELKDIITDVNPFFQAAYSIFETAAPHYTWEVGYHQQLIELRKISAVFQSPSYRAAIAILEREESDPNDPFGSGHPVVPTAEERVKAQALLEKALQECPDNPVPLLCLFTSFSDSGKLEAAETVIIKARKLAPEDPYILYLQGNILARLHRFPEATIILNLLNDTNRDLAKSLEEEISSSQKVAQPSKEK